MKIRLALLQDAKGIAKVHVDSWRTTYAGIIPEHFLNELSYDKKEKFWHRVIPRGNAFVAENKDGEIVGFACGGSAINENGTNDDGELYAIYILQHYQSQGIGRKLVNEVANFIMQQDMNSMIVYVLEENSACLFYESLGAKKINTVEVEIGGKRLKEVVYRWDDLERTF